MRYIKGKIKAYCSLFDRHVGVSLPGKIQEEEKGKRREGSRRMGKRRVIVCREGNNRMEKKDIAQHSTAQPSTALSTAPIQEVCRVSGTLLRSTSTVS